MHSSFDVQQFADDVKEMAAQSLSQPHAEADLATARLIQQYSEEIAGVHIGVDNAIDCHAGCAHCCILNVAVLQPEAESIADHLINNQSAGELLETYQALRSLELETRWLDDEERIMNRRKCAFLNPAGSCTIYPVRPLLCRAVTSTDETACKIALAMVTLGENQLIVSNLLHREIFETAFESFGVAIKEHGLDNRSHRLTGAVRTLLDKKLNNRDDHETTRGTHVN